MSDNNWMNHPAFQSIDPQKLLLLNQILGQAGSKSKDELLPFFLSASAKANSMGMSFSDAETDLIMSVLTEKMSPEEKQRVETMRRLAAMLAKQKKL